MSNIYRNLLLLLCLLPSALLAQTKFTGQKLENRSASSLTTNFKEYALFRLDASAMKVHARANKLQGISFQLHLPGVASWDIALQEHDILAADYFLTVAGPNGDVRYPKPECMTYVGYVNNTANSRVSLTMTDDLIYGVVRTGNDEYFIEPLNYFDKNASSDVFVVYNTKDVLFDPEAKCGVTQMIEKGKDLVPSPENAGLNCVQDQLAIASDASMFSRYGSATAVQAHNIGVINNVIWDYVNAQLANNVEIVIVTQHVSTIAASDQTSPLYAGTNSSTILANFRTWGQAGNFGAVTYDEAQFWTTRNIDADGAGLNSGIIGLAYVGVICGTSRYQILEDFDGSNPTGSGYQLRVLTTHEMGHNFNASHDAAGTPYIMAPTIQNTVTWSPTSITAIDNYIAAFGSCLSQCSLSGAPVADFISTPGAICVGGTLQMTDHSLKGPSSWSWTFTGGSPATSAVRNPTVSYATAGIKLISLTSSNASGSGSTSKVFLVSTAPATACTNLGTSTSNSGLHSFNLGSINRITAGSATDGSKYMDFSCTDNTRLMANTTYQVNVTLGTTVPANEFNIPQFFIDYNNDGDFADANEVVHSAGSGYIGGYSFTFTTPATPPVTNQLLRARMIAKDLIGGTNSCYNVTNGQVEDYAVFFPSGSLLSVSLISFDGHHSEGNNLLQWETASEINHSHFNLQRSIDGLSFETVTRINGSANPSTANQYAYTDAVKNTSADRFYYRLEIIDKAGSNTYSNIVVLDKIATSEITVYPNPVKAGDMIQVNLGALKADRIELINSLGQVVHVTAKRSIGNVGITTSATLATGQYVIRIIAGREVVTRKLQIR